MKKFQSKFLFVSVIFLACPLAAFASAAGHHAELPSFTDLLISQKVYWLNFIVFFALVAFLSKKIFAKAWQSRRANYQQAISSGRNLLVESEKQLSDAKQLLSSLPSEVAKLKVSLQKEADLENKRILNDASERAEKIKLQASQTAVVEKRAAINLYQEQLIELAVKRAKEKVAGLVSSDIDARLRDKIVGSVSELVN